ncbi:thymocyte nuclear protein 1-like [Octopus sinensis]|uniref:Thymocyte nuclear protein 1 n=1 Tax=Octopus sinensis TaxID=2607531 RepID=A0A6P7SEM6_9MOLL|nr:thymocyte nuclear protein 1-like [Octopus sinensis]
MSVMSPKKKLKTTKIHDVASKKDSKKPVTSYSHWLMKSEPESRLENGVDIKFSLDNLKNSPNETACWDGVRNYQARNFMKDQMKVKHKVFFYHSNCKIPGIAGICEVVKESYPDHTAFDKKDPHYDKSSDPANPKWFMVDVKYIRTLNNFIPLSLLKEYHFKHKANGGPLKNLALFCQARLSVQPIRQEEWDFIMTLEKKET